MRFLTKMIRSANNKLFSCDHDPAQEDDSNLLKFDHGLSYCNTFKYRDEMDNIYLLRKTATALLRAEQGRQAAMPIIEEPNSLSQRGSKFPEDWSFIDETHYHDLIVVESFPPGSGPEIKIASSLIFTFPWHTARLQHSLMKIGSNRGNPWIEDNSNHIIHGWDPFGFYTVHGGNHSINCGISNGEGSLHVKCMKKFDAVLDLIDTDGVSYTDIKSQKAVAKVVRPEFALVWKIGRMIIEKRRKLNK